MSFDQSYNRSNQSSNSFLGLIHQKKQEQDHDSLLSQYELPLVTVDIVVFTVQDDRLKVLLIQRKRDPFKHMWAIPGGFIHMEESLKEAAVRHLRDETNIRDIFLKQLGAFGDPSRDPRARVITVAYYALVSSDRLQPRAKDNAENIDWFCVTDLPDLAFDHHRVVDKSLKDLKDDLETSSIAFQLLPEKFTLTELQRVYELILEKKLDKRNFRKKILAGGLLQDTNETKMDGYHRPAQLFAFVDNRK